MTAEHRTLIEPRDIVAVEYACTHCGARHLVPLARFDRVIHHCPNCRELLVSPTTVEDAGDDVAIQALVKALGDLEKRKLNVRLQINNLP